MVERRMVVGIAMICLGLMLVITWIASGGLGYPSVSLDGDGEWSTDADGQLQLRSSVAIENPNPTGHFLDARTTMRHNLTLNNITLVEATYTDVRYGAGSTPYQLETPVREEMIEHWWPRFINADETIEGRHSTSLTFTAPHRDLNRSDHVSIDTLANETPLLDTFDIAVQEFAGEYGADDPNLGDEFVHVELLNPGVSWHDADRDNTMLRLRYVIRNQGQLSVPATPAQVIGEVRANEVRILQFDTEPRRLAGSSMLMPGTGDNVAIGIEMRQGNLSRWFTSHVTNDEQTTFEVSISLVFQHPETGLTLSIPEEGAIEASCTIQTSIFNEHVNETVAC